MSTPAIGDLVTGRWTSSFAELMVVPAEYAVVVPPGLSEAAGIGERAKPDGFVKALIVMTLDGGGVVT
ncbi:hypothetical protein AB0E63_30845 [Kribbella sp. NPDC026596]|uniref:hypothetical protein n=1 Tax=Kribbella sp. NPDC026596 TaxID=3155122 RepID=UPI0033D1CB8B